MQLVLRMTGCLRLRMQPMRMMLQMMLEQPMMQMIPVLMLLMIQVDS
jgi:hypothetical protein